MKPKVKPHKKKSLLENVTKPSIKDEYDKRHMVISLKHLDREQGQTFHDWEKEGILGDALQRIAGYCHDTLQRQCCTDTFKPYPCFPPKDKTDFRFPPHVPEDATWASMHINGIQRVIGHILNNVFYIVFLDKGHRFWISDIQER